MSPPAVLILAGLDPSGGAGLLADAEAVRAMGARPLCVATALTVQTTRAARRYQSVSPSLIEECARALLEEEDVRAIKIGMVGNAANASAIRKLLPENLPVVLDPVLRASSGAPLFEGPLDALLQLARGAVLTPNIAEAELLLGGPADAGLLLAKGPCAVLLKGGHGAADPVDVLATPQGTTRFQASRIPGSRRGTGCRLASALAASLAKGIPLLEAVPEAREYVRSYLQSP